MDYLNLDFIEVLSDSGRPIRAKFNPAIIWKKLDRYQNDPQGLKNFFKQFKTRVSFQPKKNLKPTGKLAVGGFYYSEENLCEICIIVKDFNYHLFSPEDWASFKYKVIQTAMHELVHLRQYTDRDFEDGKKRPLRHETTGQKQKDEDLEYYSEHDEIEAYAHCIYMDYLYSETPKSLTAFLKSNGSKTLRRIKKVFKHDTEQLAVLAMEKLAHTWQTRYNRHISPS